MNSMSGSLPRILVVDDEQAVLDGLRRTLHKEVHLTMATSARQAIEYAKDHEFAVVLTDLAMPETDGYDLIRALATISPRTICVVLTGNVKSPFSDGLPGNVFKCLFKPCDVETLVRTLHGALAEFVLRSSNHSPA
jgi:YesN/AraC family two-component response regulator